MRLVPPSTRTRSPSPKQKGTSLNNASQYRIHFGLCTIGINLPKISIMGEHRGPGFVSRSCLSLKVTKKTSLQKLRIITKHRFPIFIINLYHLYYLGHVAFYFINILSAYKNPAQHLKKQPGILHFIAFCVIGE